MTIAVIWALLLFGRYDKPFLKTLHSKKNLTRTAVIGS
jgi:hypothetical protein